MVVSCSARSASCEVGSEFFDSSVSILARRVSEKLVSGGDVEVVIDSELQGDESSHGWFGLNPCESIEIFEDGADSVCRS